MDARLHVLVRGRVQGVGFRYATYRRAEALGLAGWVRNRADGCVEAELEGDRAALETFLAWCNEGPPHARVTSVEPAWDTHASGFTGIEIR